MAETFDVAGRLAQGRPAVETVSRYVWASHQVGYQHPDLTLHPGQLGDWYGTEDGLDLVAVQRDRDAFGAAARLVDDALATQQRQLAALSGAWQGAGALASGDFLQRQSVAAAQVVSAVRSAAEALADVVEQVWRAVDAKVDAVVAIEADVAAARADWLAASSTVISGVGDRAAATEVVDTAVKPFVDTVIRTEWLSAMRAASAAVADAYRDAAVRISAQCRAVFEIPEVLGPEDPTPAVVPPVRDDRALDVGVAAPVRSVATVPSAWEAPALAPSPAPAPAPATAPAPPPAPAPAFPAAPPAPAGASMPDLGGGLPGLGSGFTDALSGLLGGGGGVPGVDGAGWEPPNVDPDPDPAEPTEDDLADEDPAEDDPDEDDLVDGPDDPDAEDADEDPDDPGDPDDPADVEPAAEPVVEPADAEVPADPPPAPTPPPPPAEPLDAAAPPAEDTGETPCAIAADEVPQVGAPAG